MNAKPQQASQKGFQPPEKKTGPEYRSSEKQTGKEYQPNQGRTGQEYKANPQQTGQEFQNPARKTGQEVKPSCESGETGTCDAEKKTPGRQTVRPEGGDEGDMAPPDGRGNAARDVA